MALTDKNNVNLSRRNNGQRGVSKLQKPTEKPRATPAPKKKQPGKKFCGGKFALGKILKLPAKTKRVRKQETTKKKKKKHQKMGWKEAV